MIHLISSVAKRVNMLLYRWSPVFTITAIVGDIAIFSPSGLGCFTFLIGSRRSSSTSALQYPLYKILSTLPSVTATSPA